MISYENFWNTLREKNISQYGLIKHHNISPAQLNRIRQNENITTYTLDVLCEILDCEIPDIITYISCKK